MAIDVFRDVAFHPVSIAAPVVPSSLVLSDESRSVLSEAMTEGLAREGWTVRRIAGVRHDMHLEDPAHTFEALRDLL